MKERETIKIKFTTVIILLILIIIALVAFIIFNVIGKNSNTDNNSTEDYYSIGYFLSNYDKGFLETDYNNSTKYQVFDTYNDYINCFNTIDKWANDMFNNYPFGFSEYNKEEYNLIKNDEITMNYYKESVEERVTEIKKGFNKGEYNKEYFDKNSLLLVETSILGEVLQKNNIEDICFDDDILNVYIQQETKGDVGGGQSTLFFITVSKENMSNIKNINIKVNATNTSEPGIDYKPIIYLYPTNDTEVSVKLKYNNNILVSYPKYSDGWNVFARKDGTLKDLKTNRELYALYYESENKVDFSMQSDGFLVKGSDSIEFLEEKLDILGLNERESEEFIVYWLPKLEANKYNYIRFASTEEINENMPLEINPNPDTIIRVLMTYKGLDNPININEQKLTPQKREGFTVVEWGGTEIK